MNINISSWLLENIDLEALIYSTGNIDDGVLPIAYKDYGYYNDAGYEDGVYLDKGSYGRYFAHYNYTNYVPEYYDYAPYYNYSNYSNYYNYSNYSNSISITTNPTAKTITWGDSVTFSIATSATPTSYQWYYATSSTGTGTAISGATSASYTFTPTVAMSGRYYYCIVTRSGATATSSRALLTVNNWTVTAPTSRTILRGESVTFSVSTSTTVTSYQWYKASSNTASGAIISGATSNSYTFTPAKEDNGTYYYCIVKRKSASRTSSRASLSIVVRKIYDIGILVGEKIEPYYAYSGSYIDYYINNAISSNTSIVDTEVLEKTIARVPDFPNRLLVKGISIGEADININYRDGRTGSVHIKVFPNTPSGKLEKVLYNTAIAAKEFAELPLETTIYPNQIVNVILERKNESKNYNTIEELFTDISKACSIQTYTNLCPDSSFENSAWQKGANCTLTFDTTRALFGEKSMKVVTGTASESYFRTNTSVPLIQNHIYYASVYKYVTSGNYDMQCYWPEAEPHFGVSKRSSTNENQWNRYSFRAARTNWSSGNYQFRFDFENNGAAATCWLDGAILVDLTETFGSGNEPTHEWCDNNITYYYYFPLTYEKILPEKFYETLINKVIARELS